MKIELPRLLQETEYTCVPACIRMVLQHYGFAFPESAITRACGSTDRGTGLSQAASAARSLGFKAKELEDLTLKDLGQFVDQGLPVIVLVYVKHLPYAKAQAGLHAVVVNGLEQHFVTFIDPARGEEIELSKDTFMMAWEERGCLALIIES